MYGTQAMMQWDMENREFENDVKMYGTQAILLQQKTPVKFENDVKMYGTQARWNKKSTWI